MHEFVFFNNQICLAEEVYLAGISSLSFYGRGVFTTIAVYDSMPFLWEKHWQRLTDNADRIGIDLVDFDEDFVKISLLEIIEKNKVKRGRVRLNFLVEKPSKIWSFSSDKNTSLLITTADNREVAEIDLTLSPYRVNSTSPLVNIKSCNYLENILALEDAAKQGFSEALRLNEKDEIVSACLANVFWIKENNIYTPSLATGCLAGTTRSFILENFPVEEVNSNLSVLDDCEAIFLTSSGLTVKNIKSFNGKHFQLSKTFSQIEEFFEIKFINKTH